MSLALAYTEGFNQGAASRIVNTTVATRLGEDPDHGPLNAQLFQTMPLTRVNPVLEQGRGRAPGWQMARMPKSLILNFVGLSNMAKHPPVDPRTMQPLFRPLGAQQQVGTKHAKTVPTVLPPPYTVMYTAAGGEPV